VTSVGTMWILKLLVYSVQISQTAYNAIPLPIASFVDKDSTSLMGLVLRALPDAKNAIKMAVQSASLTSN
jgi:hypothetical protein